MLSEPFGTVVRAVQSENFFEVYCSRSAVFRSDRYSPPLVGCIYNYSLCTDGLVCREVTGLRYKLGDYTRGWCG